MICPKCAILGKTSVVHSGDIWSTLLYYTPFYDKDGKYHIHNNNRITETFSCSNGHKWEITKHPKCPTCDYVEKCNNESE